MQGCIALGLFSPFCINLYGCSMFSKVAFRTLLAIAALSGPAAADSLGFQFADVAVGAGAGNDSAQGTARVTADFALSDVHGLQLDLGVVGYTGEFLGQLDAHLYMMPTEAAKYGLFFSLADMDGREATIAVAGVEAMFALSQLTEVHGRAGLGMARPNNVDFITATVGGSHALSDSMAVFADLTVSEFDEVALRAVASTVQIGVSYQPIGRPWEVSASIVRDGLTGRDAAAFETRAELGFTWHLGAGGGAKRSLSARAFANTQPFDPLLRRGMF